MAFCFVPVHYRLLATFLLVIHVVDALVAPSVTYSLHRWRARSQWLSDELSSQCIHGKTAMNMCDMKTESPGDSPAEGSRRSFISSLVALSAAGSAASVSAAPPFAVMSEQLGYFPVTSSSGDTFYVPSRSRRSSSDQAVELARYLQRSGAVMYGAYWCPHCRNQKEIFGKDAWPYVKYVECASQGYGADSAMCLKQGVDGYPEWKFGNGKKGSGELTLDRIAKLSGYKGKFDVNLEEPMPVSSGSCN